MLYARQSCSPGENGKISDAVYSTFIEQVGKAITDLPFVVTP